MHNRTAGDVCPYNIMWEGKPLTYESENTPYVRTNKPNLKAPLSKGSWRRQATEGLKSFVFRIGE